MNQKNSTEQGFPRSRRPKHDRQEWLAAYYMAWMLIGFVIGILSYRVFA